MLDLNTEKFKDIERFALQEFENPQLQKIYTEEFKIEFFPASTAQFIDELYSRCEAAGLLKLPPQVDAGEAAIPDPTPQQLTDMVALAETDKALLHLKVYLDRRKPRSYRLANDLVVLRNQYHLLRQRELRGTIYPQDVSVANNQIVERLLEMIEHAKNL